MKILSKSMQGASKQQEKALISGLFLCSPSTEKRLINDFITQLFDYT